MTDTALTITIAAAIFDVLRANRSVPLFGPRRSERDEQGSGEVRGEGLFLTNHNEGINS